MKVQYVGKQKPHRERLYGTKTLFSGPGDIKEFEDDIGKKMVNNHPDQYADAAEQLELDKIAEEAQKSLNTGDIEAGNIVYQGQEHLISDLSKDVLIEIAKKAWDVTIPVNIGEEKLIDKIQALINERGQPQV